MLNAHYTYNAKQMRQEVALRNELMKHELSSRFRKHPASCGMMDDNTKERQCNTNHLLVALLHHNFCYSAVQPIETFWKCTNELIDHVLVLLSASARCCRIHRPHPPFPHSRLIGFRCPM